MRVLSRQLATCAVWSVGIWRALTAGAADQLDQAGVAELEAKVGTMYVVQQLRLTSAQKQELLAIRKELVPVAEEYVRRNEAWHTDLRKYLKPYVGHYVRTGEYPPPELQEKLGKVEVDWGGRINFLRTRAAPIVDRFNDSLSDRQKARLGEIARSPFWLVGGRPMFIHSSQEDLTDPKVSDERRRLATWQRSRWGILTRAGYLCISPYLEEALGAESPAFPHWWDCAASITELWGEHVATKLTFLAGLNLDRKQLQALAKTMRKCVPEIPAAGLLYVDLGVPKGSRDYVRALGKAEKTLKRGRSFPEENMRELVKMREASRDSDHRNRKPEAEATAAIQATLEGILTGSQMVRMLTVGRCMMPTRDAANVVRAGLVIQDKLDRAGKHLDLARRRQDWGTEACDAWWRQKMYEFTRGEGAFQRLTEAERKEVVAAAWDTVKAARQLPEDQYVAKRNQLCQALVRLDGAIQGTDGDLLREIGTREGRAPRLKALVSQHMVNVGGITLALIEERLKQLESGERSGRRKRRK